jgi:predicted RNA-binding Zn ribbon-like protein
MEKNRSVATLQMLGGHPSLDFANTVAARRGRWGPDVLVTFEDLVDWAERTHLLQGDALRAVRRRAAEAPSESAAALARAKRLREALYVVFSGLGEGTAGAPEEALALLRDEYLDARAAQHLRAGAEDVGWEWSSPPGLDAVSHRIAVLAVELLTGTQTRRVKECLGPHCGWLFLDTSRNRSRRWCSDAECGTLDRVTRHRMRARAQAQQRP